MVDIQAIVVSSVGAVGGGLLALSICYADNYEKYGSYFESKGIGCAEMVVERFYDGRIYSGDVNCNGTTENYIVRKGEIYLKKGSGEELLKR